MKRSYSLVVSLALLASCPSLASPAYFGSITSTLRGEFNSPGIYDPITGETRPYFYNATFDGAGSQSFDPSSNNSDWPHTSLYASVVLTDGGRHAKFSVSGGSYNYEDARYGSYSVSITFTLLTYAEFSSEVWLDWSTGSGGFGQSSSSQSLSLDTDSPDSLLADSLSYSKTLGILTPGTYGLSVDGYSTPYHHGLSGSGSIIVTLDIIPEPATALLCLPASLAAIAIRPRR